MSDPKTLTREQVEDLRNGRAPIDVPAVAALARTALAAMDRAARWEGEHADTTVSLLMATKRAEKAEAELAEAREAAGRLVEEADALRHKLHDARATIAALEVEGVHWVDELATADVALAEARATIEGLERRHNPVPQCPLCGRRLTKVGVPCMKCPALQPWPRRGVDDE